jgi:cytochrome c biogenesis protein CcdA
MRAVLRTLLLALVILLASAMVALAAAPVEMILYHAPTCGACALFKEEVLPGLQETFGDDLTVQMVDVTLAEGLAQLEATEARLGVRAEVIPVIVISDRLFSSEDVFGLDEPLRAAISAALAQGAVTPDAPPTTVPASPADSGHVAAPIHLAYVTRAGCEQCGRASLVLDLMEREFAGLVVHEFDHVADAALVEEMGRLLGLPSERRLIAPSLYVGDRALIDSEITSSSVRALLSDYAASGAPAFWDDLDVQAGRQGVIERFQRMGPFAVVLAGLIDGINPCAFATIIFFVSYLAISRRPRRELLLVGLAFTTGVFLAYLTVGLGAMSLLSLVSSVRWLGYVLYGAMAVGCFVLAGISLYDYCLARRGQLHEMKLNLPNGMRERIKGRIRAASGAYIGAALVSGLIVSLMELACTGQVYLPTISFVVGLPGMRTQAVLYLLLYNVMFILPLLAVLLLTVFGTSAARFQDWFIKHAALAKIIMAVLFVLLGALLVVQVLSL